MEEKRRRGRPPGSRNRPKDTSPGVAPELPQETPVLPEAPRYIANRSFTVRGQMYLEGTIVAEDALTTAEIAHLRRQGLLVTPAER